MRDYSRIDKYLNILYSDIYPQPIDDGHRQMAEDFINRVIKYLSFETILDLGCGQGFCKEIFTQKRKKWTGITLGTDYDICMEMGLNVRKMDFSFLDYPDESFDLLFSRHSLEHSPMPLLTLMEWNRVSRRHLALVLPNPSHFLKYGKNHYAMMDADTAVWLLSRAGWKPIYKKTNEQEIWLLCKKAEIMNQFTYTIEEGL